MPKKQSPDIVSKFVSSRSIRMRKISNKKRDHRSFELSHDIGKRVLSASSLLTIGSKELTPNTNQLSRKNIDVDFTTTIERALDNQSRLKRFIVFLVTGRFFAVLSFIIHKMILNDRIIQFFTITFFTANLAYYSFAILQGYFYNPLAIILLAGGCYLISLFIALVLALKHKISKL